MPKIRIGEAEHDVPEAVAAALTTAEAARKAAEDQAKAAAEEVGRAKAETTAKAAAEAEAKRQAEIDRLKGKGEFDKAMELERGRTKAVADRYRDAELRSLVAAHPRLRKTGLDDAARAAAIDDVVTALRADASFDLDRLAVVMVQDGKPVEPRARIDSFLTARPYLLEPTANAGSGADPGKTGAPAVGTARSKMTLEDRAAYVAKHGTAAYLALPP